MLLEFCLLPKYTSDYLMRYTTSTRVVSVLKTLEFTDRVFQVNHVAKTQVDRTAIEILHIQY